MNEEAFDPDIMKEMSARLEEVARRETEGYELIFYISENDAHDLLNAYDQASTGDQRAQGRCWTEFMKIMLRLRDAVDNDITDS